MLPWKMVNGLSQSIIEKLDKNNFQVWKFRIINFLMGKGYWEFITGDEKEPPLLEWPVPMFLNRLNWKSEVKTTEEQGTFPSSQHFRGGGKRGVLELRDGTRKNDKCSITHMDHGLDLREATTFSFIIYFAPLHRGHIQMAFCPRTPKWESWNSQN